MADDFLITETSVDPKVPMDTVVAALRAKRITGQLIFHISQGGIQKVALIEKTKTNEEQKKQVREILGL